MKRRDFLKNVGVVLAFGCLGLKRPKVVEEPEPLTLELIQEAMARSAVSAEPLVVEGYYDGETKKAVDRLHRLLFHPGHKG